MQGKSPPVREAIEQEPELKKLHNESPLHRELLDIAAALEGLNRHAGMHAAGVVIAERPLWEYVPCFRGQNDEIVTQFAMKEVVAAGLVKFDFIGLKTLTIIDWAVAAINAGKAGTGGEGPDAPTLQIDRIPLDDPRTFELLKSAETTGVFPLESRGMKDLIRRRRRRGATGRGR